MSPLLCSTAIQYALIGVYEKVVQIQPKKPQIQIAYTFSSNLVCVVMFGSIYFSF